MRPDGWKVRGVDAPLRGGVRVGVCGEYGEDVVEDDMREGMESGYSADARVDWDKDISSPASDGAGESGDGDEEDESITVGKMKPVSSVSFRATLIGDTVEEENDIFESCIVFKRIVSWE